MFPSVKWFYDVHIPVGSHSLKLLVTAKVLSFISHVTTSETGIELFLPLIKLFQNYFIDTEHVRKYSRAAPSLQ